MKLKIIPPVKTVPEVKNRKFTNNSCYQSPIGWWRVTTEGDCEGRSTNYLGDYYGHVAEIAFHLGNQAYYSLEFDAIPNRPDGLRTTLQAKANKVSVRLGLESGVCDMNEEKRRDFLEKWFDTNDICVKKGQYHATVIIELK